LLLFTLELRERARLRIFLPAQNDAVSGGAK
jgi:hypothetical protein